MTLDEVKVLVAENKVEFFLISFVEMSGAPKAKLVPATHLEDMADEGAGFAGFAAGNMGQGPHDPDMANMPDFSSLTVVPWSQNISWVAGNRSLELHIQTVNGRPIRRCRTMRGGGRRGPEVDLSRAAWPWSGFAPTIKELPSQTPLHRSPSRPGQVNFQRDNLLA